MYSFVFAAFAGLAACDDTQTAYQKAHQKYVDSVAKTNTLMETLKSQVSKLRGHAAEFKREQMAKVALIQQDSVSEKAKLEKIVEEAESKIAAIVARSSSLLQTKPDENAPLINTDHLKQVKQNLISALDKLKAFQPDSSFTPKSFLEVASHTSLADFEKADFSVSTPTMSKSTSTRESMDTRMKNLQSRVFNLGQQLDSQIAATEAALKSLKTSD